jgi:site-specific DNA-methyltransferase (adenine-specific)
LQKYRLKQMFPADLKYDVIGEPTDLSGAQQLAEDNRFQFQWWALSLLKNARPYGGQAGDKTGKKGSDKGVDGIITFIDDPAAKPKRILVQVKSGKARSGDIRDLRGTVEREGAAMGVFVTLEHATQDMQTEAVTAGYYTSPIAKKDYPRIQILTIADLLGGAEVKMPVGDMTLKQAPVADAMQLPIDLANGGEGT